MAREFAKAWFSLFTDEDFADQDAGDKWLYIVLLGQPALNYAGVQPLNLRRWRKACRTDQGTPTEREMKARLLRLERRGYVFTDEDTGEVLARSFIRNDEVYKQPNVFKSALRAVAQIESPKLAAVMRDELDRIEQPEVKSEKLAADLAMLRGAADRHLARTLEPFAEGLPEGFGEGSVVVEVEVVGTDPALRLGEYACEETPTGQTEPTDTHIEPTEGPADDVEPPSRCRAHRDAIDDPGPCGPCANFRKAHERWETRTKARSLEAARDEAAQRREDRAAQAQAEQALIDACNLCDDNGYRTGRVCDHDPTADQRNARGAAAARAAVEAALAAKETA